MIASIEYATDLHAKNKRPKREAVACLPYYPASGPSRIKAMMISCRAWARRLSISRGSAAVLTGRAFDGCNFHIKSRDR